MSANMVAVLYLLSALLFIFALKGLSHPESSRLGNIFGIVGMIIAIITTLMFKSVLSYTEIGAAIIVGGAIGTFIALRIEMTALPQLVAAFHSLVGIAAVFVAAAAFYDPASFGIGDFGSIGYACYVHAGMLQENGIQYQKPAEITKDDATNETTVSINGVTATLPCMVGNIISGNDYIIKSIVKNRITIENSAGNVISFTNNDVAVTVTAGCNVSVDSNGNVVTSKYNESGNKKHPYKCKTTTVTKQVLSKQIDDYGDYMDRIRQRAINGR